MRFGRIFLLLTSRLFFKLADHSDSSEVFYCSVYTERTRPSLLTGFPHKMWLLRSTRRECGTGYGISMCSFTCMHCARHSWCAWGSCGLLLLRCTLCTKQGSPPPPQSFKALLCVSSLITANQGKHTLQSGMTSIYTAVCKLFQCHNKDENKKSYA